MLSVLFKKIPGKDGDVGHIILNRPQALNALTLDMVVAIRQQLLVWQHDITVKAVLVTGAGERSFCAGGDIRAFYMHGKTNPEKTVDFFRGEYRLDHIVYHYPKPYIALMQGIVMGGGVGISIGAMQRVATENMQWAMPEVGIGFYPDVGAGYFLAKCQDFIGYYLALTGMKITADEALYCNFIDAIVPQTKFPELIAAIADTSLQKEPKKITAKIITKFALPASKNIWQQSASIKQCFQRKTIEEIIAALQQENSPWAQQTMASLLRQSPTSLKVTLQKLQNLGALNFDQCLQQDFCLSQHFANATDFYEGIRAAVIDKDRQPKWQPATLAMVRQQTVDAYFQPTPTVLQFHD